MPSRRRGITAAAILTVLTGTAALAAWGLLSGVLQVNRPPRDRLPVRGVDVSHYQGDVDWTAVRAQGFTFAYVKATEGGDLTDPAYERLTAGARAAGLRVGAYHYFTFCRSGADQARHVLEVVRPRARPGDLPLVVDLEFGGNCSRVPTPARLDAEYGAFDAAVRAGFGRAPVLYVTQDFHARYVADADRRGSALAGHRLWVRDIWTEPGGRTEPGGSCGRWAFWQYAARGRVDGVRGPVDLDAYCGDAAAFEREFPTAGPGLPAPGTH